MKISLASPEQKIKALAELDGWKTIKWSDGSDSTFMEKNGLLDTEIKDFKYRASYDAIIPLIQKLDARTQRLIHFQLDELVTWDFNATPSQLCDAVLIATGKFEI